MKVSTEKPPVWDKIKKVLNFDEKTTIFTYGDTIYNPAGIPLAQDLYVHESIHARQQEAHAVRGKLGPYIWWRKYLKDPAFRIHQELEAYRAQYAFATQHIKDRNQLLNYALTLARFLAGPTYGEVITTNEALELIRNPQAPINLS